MSAWRLNGFEELYETVGTGGGAGRPEGSLLGLAAAHAVHVVHRDYKAANVLVESNGNSKLISPVIDLSFTVRPSNVRPGTTIRVTERFAR